MQEDPAIAHPLYQTEPTVLYACRPGRRKLMSKAPKALSNRDLGAIERVLLGIEAARTRLAAGKRLSGLANALPGALAATGLLVVLWGYSAFSRPHPNPFGPSPTPVEESTACRAEVQTGRWKGEYFDNPELEGSPALIRDDGSGPFAFDWRLDGPGAHCGIGRDDFSARWTRTAFLKEGWYRFTVESDDGVRLFVDDALTIDEWHVQPATTYSRAIYLEEGAYVLRMEYFEAGRDALASLTWRRLPD